MTLRSLVRVLVAAFFLAPGASGQELRVATKESPPFAYRDPGGRWVGISIELWEELSRRLDLTYELVDVPRTEDLIDGVADGEFDVAVSAISVTAEREERVDFTHPYFTAGLGVAARGRTGGALRGALSGVLSYEFLTLAGSTVLALLAAAYLFWLLERKRNKAFPSSGREGVTHGFWWSTILLFGHKGIFPVTALGRVLAATCMLVSILALSILTGAIASTLTVGHFEALIRDANDLRHLNTLAVQGTSGTGFLERERIPYRGVATVAAGLEELAQGRAEALVHDAPLLEFEVSRRHAGELQVLPPTFELQDYAIAVRQDSPLRERLNGALLQVRSTPRWQEIQFRHLRR